VILPAYQAQVELLLRILPEVAVEQVFALKGGTAINLFVREMPRFSVDIDLTYLPLNERTEALQEIADALHRVKARLDKTIPGIVAQVVPQSGGQDAKLICRHQNSTVKVEVNTIIRGHLWTTRQMPLAQATQNKFNKFVATTVVSDAELFGGKICAALDRQHPRDLFDIHQLFEHQGLTDEIRLGFLVSLLSHSRPMHELLRPQFQDRRALFETQFAGMTVIPFAYEDFEAVRERLVGEIHAAFQDDDRALLLSAKSGQPDWNLFPIAGLENMPAVQWKLANIQRLKKDAQKHAKQLRALEEALVI
jgi:predicted nucleotidyltransferase component of viral defense system